MAGIHLSLVIVVPGSVLTDRWYEGQGARAAATFRELADIGTVWNLHDFHDLTHELQVDVFHSTSDFPPLRDLWRPDRFDKIHPPAFVRFTTNPVYDIKILQEWREAFDVIQAPDSAVYEHMGDQLLRTFEGVLAEIVLAANIARIDSFGAWSVFRFINDRPAGRGRSIRVDFSGVIEDGRRRGWPDLQQINLGKVLRWLGKVPGFRNRHSESRLGRALAAASYVCHERSDDLRLVWALMGLEALYCRGNADLHRQLSEKSEAFLGPRHAFKKDFAEMYNFRSRLLHGDMDIVFPYNDYDATDQFEAFHGKAHDNENIAVGLLFATLQKMCAEDRYGLEFGYRLLD